MFYKAQVLVYFFSEIIFILQKIKKSGILKKTYWEIYLDLVKGLDLNLDFKFQLRELFTSNDGPQITLTLMERTFKKYTFSPKGCVHNSFKFST